MQKAIKSLRRLHIREVLSKRDTLFEFREDYKFIIPKQYLKNILKDFSQNFYYTYFGNSFVYRYRNVYFDTDDFQFFRRHRQGKYNRIKLRTREYENGLKRKFLEFKKKSKGAKTRKERIQVAQSCGKAVLHRAFVKSTLADFDLRPENLTVRTETSYKRISLVSHDFQTRMTVDLDVRAKSDKKKTVTLLPQHFILEVKSRTFPKKIIHLLRRKYKIRDESFSKYCVALCLLHPELKRNRWKQTLKKYSLEG